MNRTERMDYLEESLHIWRETVYFWEKSRRGFFESLKALSEALLDPDPRPCVRGRVLWDGWASASLYALDLNADPQRVGFFEDVWDGFPLRPGRRGVEWSREYGYRVYDDETGASRTWDSDDCAEHAAYLERQLRLDRNIETACALMRSATLGQLHNGTDAGGAELPHCEEVESAWRYVSALDNPRPARREAGFIDHEEEASDDCESWSDHKAEFLDYEEARDDCDCWSD